MVYGYKLCRGILEQGILEQGNSDGVNLPGA